MDMCHLHEPHSPWKDGGDKETSTLHVEKIQRHMQVAILRTSQQTKNRAPSSHVADLLNRTIN